MLDYISKQPDAVYKKCNGDCALYYAYLTLRGSERWGRVTAQLESSHAMDSFQGVVHPGNPLTPHPPKQISVLRCASQIEADKAQSGYFNSQTALTNSKLRAELSEQLQGSRKAYASCMVEAEKLGPGAVKDMWLAEAENEKNRIITYNEMINGTIK